MRLKLAIVLILITLAEFNGCYAVVKQLEDKSVPAHVEHVS